MLDHLHADNRIKRSVEYVTGQSFRDGGDEKSRPRTGLSCQADARFRSIDASNIVPSFSELAADPAAAATQIQHARRSEHPSQSFQNRRQQIRVVSFSTTASELPG